MAANTPVTSPTVLTPSVELFLADVRRRFVPNRYGQLDEKDFLAVFELAATVFADWRHLSVQRVKGATYPVPYTDNLGLIPPEYRILGMQAEAVNGVDSATGAAGVTAPPVYFTLLRDSAGPVNALLDAAATTTLTVKARWLRLGGSVADLQDQFALLELEDHDYAAGDVVKWVFADGATRLLEWRADSVGFQHPVPTGQDNDPIYAPFAPLSPPTVGLSQIQAQQLDDALPAPLAADGRTVSERLVLDVVTKLKQGRGFVGPNTGSSDRNYWEGNWELRAYNGADANYFAFVQSSKYAAMRRDAVDARIAEAIAAIPAYVEVGIDFPSAGAQSREVRINQKRLVGSVSVVSTTSAMTNLSFKKNGAVVALPVAVALGDVLTVSASMPTGGGVIVLTIA